MALVSHEIHDNSHIVKGHGVLITRNRDFTSLRDTHMK